MTESLGFRSQEQTALVQDIKKAYLKIILPFELYVERMKISGLNVSAPAASTSKDEKAAQPVGMASRMMGGGAKPDSGGVTFAQVQEASAKLNEALNVDGALSSLCFSDYLYSSCFNLTGSAEAQMMEPSKFGDKRLQEAGEACEICHSDHDHVRL